MGSGISLAGSNAQGTRPHHFPCLGLSAGQHTRRTGGSPKRYARNALGFRSGKTEWECKTKTHRGSPIKTKTHRGSPR